MLKPYPNPFTNITMSVCQHQYKLSLIRRPLVHASRGSWISHPIRFSYTKETQLDSYTNISWVHKGTWEDGVTGVQMLSTGGRLGCSKSPPLFSSSEKRYHNGSFLETAIVSSNADICFYSEYYFRKCHELITFKKKTILSSEPFSDCLNPRNSSLKEDPHSLEH